MKRRFFSPQVLATSAALALGLQSTLSAQEAPNPPVAAAPGSAPAATNAAALAYAKKTMANATAAYGKLKSYSDRFEIGGTPEDASPNEKGTLAFARPNRVAMRIEGKGYARRIVADGKFVYVSDSRLKGKYLKRPLPPGGDVTGSLIASLSGGSLFMSALLAGEEPLGDISKFKILSAPDASTLSIDVSPPMPPGSPANQVLFNIDFDPTDGLLRTMSLNQSAPKAMRIDEKHFDVQINPALPASTFTFTPSAGAKVVESLEPPTWDERLKVGAKPFAIQTNDWKGKPISLDNYKGKVLLIDFWATWCGPCRGEMPNVIRAYNTYKTRGFDIMGVSLDEDKSALTKYVAQNKMPWRQIFDGKGWSNAVGEKYGVKAIPFSLLIGRDGKIAAINPRGAELEPALKAALKK